MKLSLKWVLLLSLICQPVLAMNEQETVKEFVKAFNERDLNTMLDLAGAEMKWLSISGKNVSVETSSQEELKQAMQGYFTSMPFAKSEIRQMEQSGPFVYALEEAFWTVNGTTKSQCSMAVYELADKKIKHVWYFPSHKC